jgi:hypothetical protein
MTRLTGSMLGLGLLASLLVTAAPASAAPLPCQGAAGRTLRHGLDGGLETVTLRTFHIEAKTKSKAYRIGEFIKVPVEVTRPAKEDPLRLDLPWERPFVQPAADVNVGVGLLIGEVFLPGYGKTNEDGKTTIKIKVERYVKPAKADAAFYSWNVMAESPCFNVQEDGFRIYPEMFKVRK